MKRSEVAKLVTVIWAAEGYNREPSDADVEIWFAFARDGGWESYEAALQAYVSYRNRQSKFRLNPGCITEILDEVRRAGSRSFELAIERVPDRVRDAEDFDTAYRTWFQEEAAKHRAQVIEAFVAGQGPGQRAIEA